MNRYDEIIELRLAGLTFAEIARRMGVSRQRVQQIVAPPKPIRDQVVARADGKCESCGVDVGKSGHVHHGAPGHKDGDWYNQIDRLQLFCVGCHKRVHEAGELSGIGKVSVRVEGVDVVVTAEDATQNEAIARALVRAFKRQGHSVTLVDQRIQS